MSPTRHDAEWQSLAGHTYQELGHRDKIDWHYHDVQQIVYPSSGVLAISAAAAAGGVDPGRRAARAPGPRPGADADAGDLFRFGGGRRSAAAVWAGRA